MNRVTNFYAKVYSSAGVYLGDLLDLVDWSAGDVIDRAAQYSLTCLATFTNSSLLVELRRLDVYGTVEGVERLLSSGPIINIDVSLAGEKTCYAVQGEDRLHDLADRTITDLEINEKDWLAIYAGVAMPQRGAVCTITDDISNPPPTGGEKPNCFDGNPATNSTIDLANGATVDKWVYIGFDQPFDSIRWDISSANTVAFTKSAQIYHEGGWTGLTITSDTTEVGGKPFAQDGDIGFTEPADWQRYNAYAGLGSWFWVRIQPATDVTPSFGCAEVSVHARVPTLNALNLIMAYAPAGWKNSAYGNTGKTVYLQINGRSILNALQEVRKVTGEHFRALNNAGTMEIEWISTWADSGMIVSGAQMPDATHVKAEEVTKKRDASAMVTRVYPIADDDITLANTDRTASAPYELSTASNWIRNSTSETSYKRIDRTVRFNELFTQNPSSFVEHPRMVANALFDRALEWLKLYDAPQRFYTARSVGWLDRFRPGQKITVDAEATVQGTKVEDINELLYCTGVTHYLDEDDCLAGDLEVSTIDRVLDEDTGAVVNAIGDIETLKAASSSANVQTITQTIQSTDVNIDGGTIDGTVIGADDPASGKFTSLQTTGALTLPAKTANTVFAGPVSGGAAVPDFRALVDLDIPTTIVRTSRQVISGAGLTGGGDLSADRTLAVGAGTLITVNADDVALAVGSAQYQVPVTGATPFTPAWTLLSAFAGGGLTFAAGLFDLQLSTNAGLQLTGASPAQTLEMGAPSTVTAASTNAVSAATHSHAVTATADGATSHSTLLKSGASGELQLDYADLLTDLTVPEINAAAALTLKPATDLILDPISNLVKLTSTVSIQADNFASQTTGWRVTYEGAGDFRYLFADEMHVKSFIADLEQALAGGQIICKSVSTLAVAYTLPAAGGASTVWIKDLPSAENMAVFQSGDLIRFRQFSRAGGELTVADAWGVVTAYADQANKMQTWTFTRSAGGLAGAASGVIPIDAIVLDYGVTGNGYYEVNAIDGLYADNSPYSQVVTWTTHPLTTLAVRTRLGNLHGIYSLDNEYGLSVSGANPTVQYLRLSESKFEVHGLQVDLWQAAAINTIRLNPTIPAIQIGNPIPTGILTGDGIYMGVATGVVYGFRVGTVSGGALVKGMHWDGASLDIRGNLIVGPGHGFVLESPSMVCAYDGPRPYATDFQVDTAGHLGQRGTAVGAVIGRPGVFGKALQTGRAATNLMCNPVFGGTYTSGLAPSLVEVDAGSKITPTENIDMAYIEYGIKSQKLVIAAGAGTDYIYTNPSGMANSTTYTWYMRFYLAAGSVTVGCDLGTGGHTENFNTLGWNTFCYTGATAGSGSNFTFWVLSTAGATVYLTRCQVVAAAYNTPLISGDLPGHTWAGTAYASTSYRDASYVNYPISDVIKDARRGSVGCWVYCEGWHSGYSGLWSAGNVNAELDAWISPAGELYGQINSVAITQATTTVRAWHHVVMTWDCDSDLMYPYVNGVQGTHGHPTTTTPTLHASTFGVGYNAPVGAGNVHQGYICDFFVTEAVLTADQVRQIYESGLPVVATRNPMSLLLTGAGRGKVEGSAGGIFGLDALGKPTWTLLNEATVVNGESLGIGDVLLGDNTASKANMLWDQSAGKLLFRGGVTSQVEIGTDGKLAAGAGAVLLSAAGIAITAATDAYSSIAEYGFDFGGNREAGWFSYVEATWHYNQLHAYSLADRGTSLIIGTHCPANKESDITIAVGRNAGMLAAIEMGTTNSGEIEFNATRLGFYDTAAIAKQTGVAVSAAGIHAALVALGLIEA